MRQACYGLMTFMAKLAQRSPQAEERGTKYFTFVKFLVVSRPKRLSQVQAHRQTLTAQQPSSTFSSMVH
jgi:hypothetical protein